MHAAWVAFIRSGNPSGGGLRWEAYDPARRLGMRFDGEPRTISDIDRPGRLLWDDWVPAAYRPGD
jgi:carboxylesterase type B